MIVNVFLNNRCTETGVFCNSIKTHQALKQAEKENEDLRVSVKELQEKIGQAEQFQEQRAQVQFHVIFVLFSILTLPFPLWCLPDLCTIREQKKFVTRQE